jgi:hypothetical protein
MGGEEPDLENPEFIYETKPTEPESSGEDDDSLFGVEPEEEFTLKGEGASEVSPEAPPTAPPAPAEAETGAVSGMDVIAETDAPAAMETFPEVDDLLQRNSVSGADLGLESSGTPEMGVPPEVDPADPVPEADNVSEIAPDATASPGDGREAGVNDILDDPGFSWDELEEEPEPSEDAPPSSESPAREQDPGGLASAPIVGLVSGEQWDPSQVPPMPAVLDTGPTVVEEVKQPKPSAGRSVIESVVRTELWARAWLPRLLAIGVGLMLIAGGLRAVELYGIRSLPGPGVIKENGWMASDIRLQQLRADGGRRVWVVHGSLRSSGATLPPNVQVTLLNANHQPVLPPVTGKLTLAGNTLPGEPVGSESALAQQESPWASPSLADHVTGFRVVIPDPPPAARRYRLELLPASGPNPI